MDRTNSIAFKKYFWISAILSAVTYAYSFIMSFAFDTFSFFHAFSFLSSSRADIGPLLSMIALYAVCLLTIFLCLKLKPEHNASRLLFILVLVLTLTADAICFFVMVTCFADQIVSSLAFILIAAFPFVFLLINELCYNALNTATKIIVWLYSGVIALMLVLSFCACIPRSSSDYIISMLFTLVIGFGTISFLIGCMKYSTYKAPKSADIQAPPEQFTQYPYAAPQQPYYDAQQSYAPPQSSDNS